MRRPQSPWWNALAVRPHNRSRAPGALLLAVGLGASALTSCVSGDATAKDSRDAATVHADYYASEHGVRVGIKVGYSEAREVTGARLVAGDESVHAPVYPLDGTDPDVEPESVTLVPGGQVSLEGVLLVPCSVPARLRCSRWSLSRTAHSAPTTSPLRTLRVTNKPWPSGALARSR